MSPSQKRRSTSDAPTAVEETERNPALAEACKEPQKHIPTPTRVAPQPPPPQRASSSMRSLAGRRGESTSRQPPAKAEQSGCAATGLGGGQPFLHALAQAAISVVAQTIDFDTLASPPFDGTLLNPFLLYRGTKLCTTQYHIWASVQHALTEHPESNDVNRLLDMAMERYVRTRVELGLCMMDSVPGPHHTFVDPDFHNDREAIVAQAARLLGLFEKHGVDRSSVIVSIPSTDDGIRAARQLETDHLINTNLILVSGLTHASVCLEAGPSALSFTHEILAGAYQALIALDTSHSDGDPVQHARDAATKAIRITAALRLRHKVSAKLFVTDAIVRVARHDERALTLELFPQLDEIPMLHGIDGLALRQRQYMQVRSQKTTILPPPDRSSDVMRRARLAQYPTTYLSQNSQNFLAALGPRDQFLAQSTLSIGLRAMICDLEATKKTVYEELEYRIFVQSLDVNKLMDLYIDDAQRVLDDMCVDDAAGGEPRQARNEYNPRTRHLGFRLIWSQLAVPPRPAQDLPGSQSVSDGCTEHIHFSPDDRHEPRPSQGESLALRPSAENGREEVDGTSVPHCKGEARRSDVNRKLCAGAV
ncbi:uncharacterized protein FIBRA_04057 [Fibroporia radiculosa]|uniref:Uncharacterized protein n=1 Tax=Fibroporia radiculosa TaxID=599839 RepID=J4G6S4_9APHY|nr:uncharacterized protein FIBRA_04057 [Fibroporia radiculosa]CCM01983.1 predicted protein [Fibroporia radiculosa]